MQKFYNLGARYPLPERYVYLMRICSSNVDILLKARLKTVDEVANCMGGKPCQHEDKSWSLDRSK